MEVRRALFCTESPRSTQQIHELFVPLGVETCRTTLPTSVQPVCTATSQRALLVYSLCNAGLLSCGCAVRKRGNQLVMGSLCLVRMVKGSHALGGPCMDVSRALFCAESPRSTQQIHELFVQLGVETCRTALPQSVRPVCTATSQRALLVCTACVMSVCPPVDVQSASAVTSWSWAVCALSESEWSKDPMLLEDLAWMSAGLCSAPRVRGPRSKSMSCLCSSVWRLAERPCPNRFGLCAQRRAESRACQCTAVALCTTACSRWPTAQLGFAKEPALSDQAWMLAGAEASTHWASFVQPVCICCR